MSWQMAEQFCLLSAWACMIRGSVFPYAWPSLWLDQWPAFDNPVCWDVQRDLSLFSQKPHRPSIVSYLPIYIYQCICKILLKFVYSFLRYWPKRAITMLFLNEIIPLGIPYHSSPIPMSMQCIRKILLKFVHSFLRYWAKILNINQGP